MKRDEMELSNARLLALLKETGAADLAVLREYNLPEAPEALPEELVAAILQHGSHDVKRHFSGMPSYLQLVRDVAKTLQISWTEEETEAELEQRIYLQVFHQAVEQLSLDEKEPLRQLLAKEGANAEDVERLFLEGTLRHFLPAVGYLVSWNVARLVATAFAREAGAGLLGEGVAAAWLGPLGLALGALVVGWDLAGPAYRKTIPTVVQIAYLREKARRGKEAGKGERVKQHEKESD